MSRADIIYLRGVATSEERAARVTLTQLRANKIGGDLYRSPLFSSRGFQSSSELVDSSTKSDVTVFTDLILSINDSFQEEVYSVQ